MLENEQKWVKKSLTDVKGELDKIKAAVERYKWWILGSVLGGMVLSTTLAWLIKVIAG